MTLPRHSELLKSYLRSVCEDLEHARTPLSWGGYQRALAASTVGLGVAVTGCELDPNLVPEDCNVVGDEDDNGLADCADPACSDLPQCAQVRYGIPLVEDCSVRGDEDGNGLADCDDPVCMDNPECQPVVRYGIPM